MLERHELDFLGSIGGDGSVREQDLTRRLVGVQLHVCPFHGVSLVSERQEFGVVHEAALDASAENLEA